jgi:hypothetical protein
VKRTHAVIIVFLVVGMGATVARAQANVSRKKTIYVPPPMGTHLGGGFVDSGGVDNEATSRLGAVYENANLRKALTRLDAKATKTVEGWSLIATAVSWQTKVPVELLKKQRAMSGLTYGQLLVANSLASGSGKSFEQVLVLRAKSRNWSQLAEDLRISVKSIVGRLDAAGSSIEYAEYRRKIRREQNLKEADFLRDPREG